MPSSERGILVINCGSSSLKFSVLPQGKDTPLFYGIAQKLGLSDAEIIFHDEQGQTCCYPLKRSSHQCALETLFAYMRQHSMLGSLCAIGHRVAHGGNLFSHSVLINDEVIAQIRGLCALAPLHNPANLIGIRSALELLPDIPQIAVFDTAFHQTIPAKAYTYAIPLEYRELYQVRRYGFHGSSHRYITAETIHRLGLNPAQCGIVIAHLGNGSSVCAVKNAQSVDTSMGMTPLEGLVMGTRCGDLDCGILAYLVRCTKQSIESLYELMNNQSGLLGLSGISSDFRALQSERLSGNPQATLAIDVMIHRLARHIGGHMASLECLDALVFTGGIGENSPLVRELTVKSLAVFGFRLDERQNNAMCFGESGIISQPNTPVVMVIPTNEEKMIAKDAADIAQGIAL